MLTEMKVHGIALDPATNEPIVLLRDLSDESVLPVWVGVLEARAIASEMEKVRFSRPMTHDLIKDIIDGLSASIARIEVTDIRENVYYACIRITTDRGQLAIDARPSDAIALALRTESPIFAESSLLRKADVADVEAAANDRGIDRLKSSDFGKYKM